ncbi:NUDIX hydrolase [Nocardiopsis sp. CA-288880]|uniref:NUDIX hydrolase n=1 Tax=Nocardiopsis sp. CA-288880 TaxID=3239995 RepID=UPI003D954B6B
MDPYTALRASRPEEFANPSGGIEILTDPEDVAKAREHAGGCVGVVYADEYVTVVRDAVRFPDGRLGAYVRVLGSDREPGVVVLPLLGDSVVLVEHFRHATRAWHVEAPRGFGEDGEPGEAGVRRELREELGTEASELFDLGSLHPDSGLFGGHARLWAARVASLGPLDVGEGLRRSLAVSPGEAEEMVRDGRITDAFTIAVLTRARMHGLLD